MPIKHRAYPPPKSGLSAAFLSTGRAGPGADLRFIDENGQELPRGAQGEIVGRSAGMMTGYHRLPAQTREAEWISPSGERFIRSGDVGQMDADGFIVLGDRKKDLIITGGFNVYPSDIGKVLKRELRAMYASAQQTQ